MSVVHAIILGIVQGLTEFLPVSSTAHLTLAGIFLGLVDPSNPADWTAFIAVIQLGTAAAVLLYFAKDLGQISASLLRLVTAMVKRKRPDVDAHARMGILIILGTIPVVVAGLLLKDLIHSMFTKELSTIGTSLIVLAVVLWWAERVGRRTRPESETNWKDALLIGVAQAMALIPGSSRSGTTITAGLFLGLTREAAARFSFLLSIPAVLASGGYELYKSREHLADAGMTAVVVATIVSGIVGYAAIAFLIRYLRTNSTLIFVIYRIAAGLAIWALILGGVA
jgi:undecaprenyl-diphosphatase